MGKKLDALFGRSFKATKFNSLVSLAISRLSVLKNQRHARSKQARSDVLQLLQLGHHERALLRVEHVIKEQDMIDMFDKIEGYCNILIERVHLIEQERECPEELKEAVAGLLYAASRCGEFPELHEIRAVLTCRFGKEFAARAIELRNNCGVHPKMVQMLSTKMPSLESRMKVLKEIASQNGIILQLEQASVLVEEQSNVEKLNKPEPEIREEQNLHILPYRGKYDEFSDSFKTRQKYKDVTDAAQAAFESATYAAAAARAAVELSRSEPHYPDHQNSPSPRSRKVLDGHDSVEVKSQLEDKEILTENQEEVKKNAEELEKPKGIPSSMDAEVEVEDESDNEKDNTKKSTHSSEQISSRHHAGIEAGTGYRNPILNAVSGFRMLGTPHLDLKKRPLSVRTRQAQVK